MSDKKVYRRKKLGSYPYLSVVLSSTTALFVLGLFSVIIMDAQNLSKLIKERFEIQIFLNNTLADADRVQVEKLLSEKKYIMKNEGETTFRYITKEEAAKTLTEQLDEDFESLLGENPLKNSYIVHVKAAYFSEKQLKNIEKELKEMRGVSDVSYPQNMARDFSKNLATISFILFSFTLFMCIVIVILINNTIKLALFSQRFLIRTMQLVGATATFIRRPFLKTAILQGVLSGAIASLLLLGLVKYVENKVPEFQHLHQMSMFLLIAVILLALGALISTLSSYRAVNKYLGMSLDELY